MGLTKQNAQALLVYLQKAVPVVQITAAEWMAAIPAITVLEQVASGNVELEVVERKDA